MEAKKRLSNIYNYYNTNASKIERIVKKNNPQSKFSKQTLYNIEKGLTHTISNSLAEILIDIYPELDFIWLTIGKGEMFNKNIVNSNIAENGNNEKMQELAKDIVSLEKKIEILEMENKYLKEQLIILEKTFDMLQKLIIK